MTMMMTMMMMMLISQSINFISDSSSSNIKLLRQWQQHSASLLHRSFNNIHLVVSICTAMVFRSYAISRASSPPLPNSILISLCRARGQALQKWPDRQTDHVVSRYAQEQPASGTACSAGDTGWINCAFVSRHKVIYLEWKVQGCHYCLICFKSKR